MTAPSHPPTRLPWAHLPQEAARYLSSRAGEIAVEVVEQIERNVPAYSVEPEDGHRDTRVAVVRRTLEGFAALVGRSEDWSPRSIEFFQSVGRNEARAGRDIDSLQSALRLGARVLLRRLGEESERLGLSHVAYGALAEAVFVSLDQIAMAAARGYRDMLGQSAKEMERRRIRLFGLLVAEPSAPAQAVTDLAREAGWRAPRTVAAVALGSRDPARLPVVALPPEFLVDVTGRQPCVLVPDPDRPGRLPELDGLLGDWHGALGPTVELGRAATSLRWARETLTLMRRGIVPAEGMVRAADHLPTLALFQQEELVGMMAARRLVPLLERRPSDAERLGATLLVCLQQGFNATEAANRLHVHPQTVRYRVNQLHGMFGDALYDPEIRLELEMALHAWLATVSATAERQPGGEVITLTPRSPARAARVATR